MAPAQAIPPSTETLDVPERYRGDVAKLFATIRSPLLPRVEAALAERYQELEEDHGAELWQPDSAFVLHCTRVCMAVEARWLSIEGPEKAAEMATEAIERHQDLYGSVALSKLGIKTVLVRLADLFPPEVAA